MDLGRYEVRKMREMTIDDAELLTRSRERDADAFGQLVERHKDQIVNYLARLTGCRDRAEDIAQETFVRFYKQLHHYREEGTLSAYLFRIATNLVRSEERRKRRWKLLQPILTYGGFYEGHASPASPQTDALASEEHRQVTRALASLDVLFRAPLVLREIEGLSYQEIAVALGCSEGTVKSRLHRGRHLLKERLAPYWNGGRQT